MTEWLSALNTWHWLGFGLLLLILEMLANIGFLLWIGIAACIVAITLMLFPKIIWQYQFLLFSIGSVASIVIWQLYRKHNPIKTTAPTLNRRSAKYIGRIFTLTEPIINGRGHIHVEDSMWQINGEDMPAGMQVKVVNVDGVILSVEKIVTQIFKAQILS